MAKITKGDVYNCVKENLVPVNNKRVECADGRYMPVQSQGAIRAFGGDFGFVLAFAAALREEGTHLLPNQIVERYYNAIQQIRGEDTRLYYHTDEHNHAEGKIGCGHAEKATDAANDGMYGVRSLEAQNLYQTFARHPSSSITILNGHHEEKGVLQVEGKSHSLNSRKHKNMFFVVTPDMIDHLIDTLAPIFSQGLEVPLDPQDIKDSYEMQQDATAKLLGADKLPTYKVGFNNNGHFVMEQLP